MDLVYLDPPFNSAQNYNAFFQEKDGTAAAAQIRAFEDTWEWNQDAEAVWRVHPLARQSQRSHASLHDLPRPQRHDGPALG